MTYHKLYTQSIQHKEQFWLEQSAQLNWIKAPSQILTPLKKNRYEWFNDGLLNVSHLCLDTHIANGHAHKTALIYDAPVTQTVQHYTYGELLHLVSKFAGGLTSLGVTKGDTVVIYMPMIPQAVIAMLACARIGAIHSVVFGGFAPHELAMRIDDAKPKVLITASYGIEVDKVISYKPLVDKALKEANHRPQQLILYKRPNDQNTLQAPFEIDFDTLLQQSEPATYTPVLSTHPLYILYTSGTT